MSRADLLASYAASGDAEAFARMVEQYQRLVFATCRRVLRDPNHIDDATQETFLRLAKKAGAIQSNLGAWLHRCAMNVAIDFNRRQAARMRHESAAAQSGQIMDQTQRELSELREHLDAALEKLDEADRELIIQRFFTGRPQIEMAAEAGVAPATMSYRMERTIGRLRKHFEAMSGAGVATEAWRKLLEAEHLSASVPAKLTANVMKIGLSAAPVAATASAAAITKIVIAAIGLLVIFFGSWKLLHRDAGVPQPPSLPVISTGNNAETPHWQTTQPSVRAVLAGRILDDANHGIAGAIVRLDSIPSGFDAAIRTDGNGNYEFVWIPRAETFRIGVSADGFVLISTQEHEYRTGPEVEMTPTSQTRRDIIMERGVRVEVTVTDALEQPIAGAWVTAFAHNNSPMINVGQESNDLGAVNMTVPVSDLGYTVAAQASGYAPTHAIISARQWKVPVRLNFALAPGRNIKGIAICSDGKPAAGERIEAIPEWWMGMFVLASSPIDASGNFTLHDIGRGRYRLMIMSDMQDSVAVSMPPARQPVHINFPFPSPGTIPPLTGTIHIIGGPLNDDIFAAAVEIPEPGKQYSLRIHPPARGQQSLSVDFGRVPPGKYELRFWGPGIERFSSPTFTVPGPLPAMALKVVGVAHLDGRVVDASSGQPIANFAVRSAMVENGGGIRFSRPEQSPWVQVSNPRGEFELTVDGAGVYVVQASADGRASITSGAVRVKAGAMTGRVIVKMNRAK